MKTIIKDYHNFLKERIKGDKAVFAVELIYVLFCLGSAVYFFASGKTQNALMSMVFPLIVFAVNLIEWKLAVRGGVLFYIIFFCMCTSNILGNGFGLYEIFKPYFDKVMHTLSGIAFTCFGYMLMKKMVEGDDGKKFVYCLIFGFVFAMAAASVWEVYEYFVSEVLHSDMQTNYIVDTIDYISYISNTTVYFTDGTSMEFAGYIDIGLFDTLQDITVCLCGSLVTIGLLVLDNYCFKRMVNRLIVPEVLRAEKAEGLNEVNNLIEEKKTA